MDFSSLFYEQKRIDDAINVITEALNINPESAELYYRLVAYLFASGQYNEALNFLEIALAFDPDNYQILFEYLPQLQGNKIIVEIIKKYSRNS